MTNLQIRTRLTGPSTGRAFQLLNIIGGHGAPVISVVRRQDIDREETIHQAMPKRPALESLPRTINLLAFIRLTLLQCSAFSYALSLGYLPKSLFKPVCLISLGQSRPAWEGSFRPGKQLSSSQEETAKRREEEDWKMKTSEGEEINQQGEPPNKSINRTRKPTPHYPFTHSGPVISGVKRAGSWSVRKRGIDCQGCDEEYLPTSNAFKLTSLVRLQRSRPVYEPSC